MSEQDASARAIQHHHEGPVNIDFTSPITSSGGGVEQPFILHKTETQEEVAELHRQIAYASRFDWIAPTITCITLLLFAWLLFGLVRRNLRSAVVCSLSAGMRVATKTKSAAVSIWKEAEELDKKL